ncbi:MAG: glycoside hydrolase family 130 protein [Planctomycetota bacterium]
MAKNETLIGGQQVPNMPWEGRPEGCTDPMWRYSGNPVIPRDLIPSSNSIFNSAVVPFQGEFAGVFRCDDRRRHMQLHAGRSEDGIDWHIENEPIEFECDIPALQEFRYGYDPRVCWIEDRYYVQWCNWYHGPTIGLAWTRDFQTFRQMENAYLPYNRDGVLFPRRFDGDYLMLSRPSDRGHTPFGDIYISASPDLVHWGRHRFVMEPTGGWQSTKIGAGPIPIETTEGWLLIYHGVLTSCNGFWYSAGVALLDNEHPWKVRARAAEYVLAPNETYECVGDVPNVVFPCAALCDAATGRIALYYGAADTVTCLAFAYVDELVEFALEKDES